MITFKKWQLKNFSDYKRISEKYGILPLAAKAAASRLDIMSEKDLFEAENHLYSPFDLIDMQEAADRVNAAVYEGEKIVVYGDYDADGVTATAILYSYLEAMGADVSFYIPSREEEGYGLNVDAIDLLYKNGCQLILTVDNGISAIEEIEYAKSLGLDVVVTDHHMPQKTLPNCICVDPHREDCPSKFKDICGAFVAFKLVAALDGGDYDGAFEEYAELVAIATLADVVPLTSENRTIVKLGVERLSQTDNLGLLALMNSCFGEETEIDATSVSFGIIPRINAAGRMGNADRAVKLLLAEDEDAAEKISGEICRENDNRKNIEAEILEDIEKIFEKNPQMLNSRIIVVCSSGWHHGVLGIVASRIVDKYGKPAIVLSEEDGVAVGSGRSVEGFDLFSALSSCQELFTRFGGHSLAAGVTIDGCKVQKLCSRLNDYASENYAYMPEKSITADALISPNEITLASVKELSMLSPFGKDNSEPVFMLKGASVLNISSIGNGKHSRLSLSLDGANFNAVCFGITAQELSVYYGRKVDALIRLKPNTYQGVDSVSIQIVDIRPENINDELFFKEKQIYDLALLGENLTEKQAKYLMPTREEAAEIYKMLKNLPNYDKGIDILWWQLGGKISRAKLAVIVEAFSENELISLEGGKIAINPVLQKKDLFACDILKHIASYIK